MEFNRWLNTHNGYQEIKCPGVNLTNDIKDFHKENVEMFHTLKEETEDTEKGEKFHIWGIQRINIIKMSILFKAIHRFNEIQINYWGHSSQI